MTVLRKSIVRMLCICLGMSLIAIAGGCGVDPGGRTLPEGRTEPPTPTPTETSVRTSAPGLTVTTAPDGTTTPTGPVDGRTSFPAAFVGMAESLAPVRVYGWPEIPEGTTVAPEWWPVTDCSAPDEYQGPTRTNPWINPDPFEPEAQLVLDTAGGWLIVLENFRGDLGDVSGRAVGNVHNSPAYLHEVNGGYLVQWSYEGRWYGVFGRGAALDLVVGIALQMQPVSQ